MPPSLNDLETQFAQLSSEAQFALLERLVQYLRAANSSGDKWETGLAAMADDAEVQRELRSISSEFAPAETDGLGKSLML